MVSRKAKGEFITPSDGYRALAVDLLLPTIEGIDRGRQLERNIGFLLSKRARALFMLLDIDPDRATAAVLGRNGIEIIRNGNGHD